MPRIGQFRMMIGQVGWEKIGLTGLSNIWRLSSILWTDRVTASSLNCPSPLKQC